MISIIVPVFNAEKYLCRCLDSILNQTIVKDIEIICVNDCSTDNSLQILNQYKLKYPNNIFIYNATKKGLCGGSRNIGIRNAKGEYIGFVDSDDYIDSQMYEKLLLNLQKYDSDISYCQYRYVGNTKKIQSTVDKRIINLNGKELNINEKNDLIAYQDFAMWAGLYKKRLFFDNNLFFPDNIAYEDNYLSTFLYAYSNRISFIEDVLYFYCFNQESITKNTKYFFDRIRIEELIIDGFKERGLYINYSNSLEYLYTCRYVFDIYGVFLFGIVPPNFEEADKLIKKLKKYYPNFRKNHYYSKLRLRRDKIKDFMRAKVSPKVLYFIIKFIRKVKNDKSRINN